MISSTSLLSAPSMVDGAHPARDTDVPARRHGLDHLKGWVATSTRPTIAPPPASAESALAKFLGQSSVEVAMLYALQPPIAVSNLQDPLTFDLALQRTRRVLRETAAQGGKSSAILQAALQVLDRNVVLRTQSRVIRNALYQG